jgi:hypothetical protein
VPKYVKGKDGKFVGSIGDGKSQVPTAATSKAQLRVEEINARVRAMNENAAVMREQYARLAEVRQKASEAWSQISDDLNVAYPEARWMYISQDGELLRLADRDHNTLVVGSDVEVAGLADNLELLSHHEDLVKGRYLKDGEHRVGVFFRCGIDGCTFRQYPEGFQPGHTASSYCRSGKRPHCTCDTCF